MEPASIADLRTQFAELLRPQERLSLSEWAEENFIVSVDYGGRSGPLKLFGWQRELFDAFTDPRVETIVLMVGTQLTKTLFIQVALAYIISNAPGPCLIIQPSDTDASEFSKERLAPMLRDCEVLRGLVADSKSRASSNTIGSKDFAGGRLTIVGSISPRNLARRSIRYLLCDEPDKYERSAGTEGDPIALALQRTVTFRSQRKIVLACSPTEAGRSRIAKAYSESDERRPLAPCPHCGQFQELKWAQVKWNHDVAREQQAATAAYHCAHCEHPWTELQRRQACNLVRWHPRKAFHGTAGFWLSHLYSPWEPLSDLVERWLAAQHDPPRLKVFVNTDLAELWQEEGETPDFEILFARRENYPFGDDAIIPQRGLFLTAAVDVQDNPPRLECEIVAWGRDRESWSIDYRVIQCFAENGQPLPVTSPELWARLNSEVLQREYIHASGNTLPIAVMAIDTGSRPKPVYQFSLQHPQPAYGPAGLRVFAMRTVVPVKGTSDALRIIAKVSKEDASRKRQGVRIVGVGTACAKQELYDLLRHVRPRADGGPVPGCCHFPMYERLYFEGLCAEKRIVKESGAVVWDKLPGVRNEPLDLRVYNRTAASIFGIERFTEAHWNRLEQDLGLNHNPPLHPANTTPGPSGGSAQHAASVPESPPSRPSEESERRRQVNERKNPPGWLGRRGRSWFDRR